MNPLMKGVIYSCNAGWYNTAKVHKNLGIDLSLRLNASFVPSSAQIFSVTDLDYISVSYTHLTLPTKA